MWRLSATIDWLKFPLHQHGAGNADLWHKMMGETGEFPNNYTWDQEKQMYILPWHDCDSYVLNETLQDEYQEWFQDMVDGFPELNEDKVLRLIVEEQIIRSA